MSEKEYQTPPYSVSKLEYVIQLCAAVQNTTKPRDSIIDDVDVPKPYKVITYADRLGFVEKVDSGFKATDAGIKLSFANVQGAGEIVHDTIRRYNFYRDLSEIIYKRYDSLVTQQYLPRKSVEKEIQLRFEFDVSSSVRKDIADQYLRTLDWAGLGDRISGSSSKPARLEFGDDFRSSLSELTSEDGLIAELSTKSNSAEQPTAPKRTMTEEGSGTSVEVDSIKTNYASSVNLNIQFEIDGSDDPKNVRSLMRVIREELQGDMNEVDNSKQSESTVGLSENYPLEPANSLDESEVEDIGSMNGEVGGEDQEERPNEEVEHEGGLDDFF